MMGVQVAGSRRILLVDDEPENLDVLSVLLEDDFDIHVAHGGKEALAIFSKVGDFASVISDQRMPGMTGVELMIELRRLAPATVRMVLTGYSDLPPIVAAVNKATSTDCSSNPGAQTRCGPRSPTRSGSTKRKGR